MGERLTLLRSTITKPQTLPGWVWVGNFSEEEIVKNLRVFAAYDRNATVRKRALSLLTDLKIPLEVGVIEDLNFGETVIADSDTDVVEAACDYLGAVGTEELFPLLDSIDQPEAQIAHLRILMRVRPDEAVHDVIELPESTGKIRAAVEEQMGTLRKESVRILLSSANSAIRCMALNELSTRGALAEAEARSALDDQNIEVRRSALDVLIRQAASGIDTKMIREKGRADMPTFFQAWTGPDEEDLILSLFRKTSYEQLSEKLHLLSLDAAFAYRVLAEDHFARFEPILRDDLASKFEARHATAAAELREDLLRDLPDLPEVAEIRDLRERIDKLIATRFDSKSNDFVANHLTAAASRTVGPSETRDSGRRTTRQGFLGF